MTHPPRPTERFAQHPRLSELVTALGFRRYPLFLTGLLYQEPGGPLRRATTVASRDGDLVAYDAGEMVELAGRVPTSRPFDDDLTRRSPKTLVDALADRNQASFAHEVAAWTRGRRSVDEVGIELLHHWSCPEVSAAGHHGLRGHRGGPARGHRRPAGRAPPLGWPSRARLPGRAGHGAARHELTSVGAPCQERLRGADG
jgi:hypothetical protein